MSLTETVARAAAGPIRLRARWVLPIDQPPIEDGEVVVEQGRIVSVGKAPSGGAADAHDFGPAAILPGLINVHAHLEYTLFRGFLEEMPFFPWIRTLTALKAHLTPAEWVASATLGAAEMAAAGVTTVADASDAGAALTALIASGHRGIVYREVFGIEASPSVEDIIAQLDQKVEAMRAEVGEAGASDRMQVGISPHAPYTVRPELFRALAEYAERRGLPRTIHVAETLAESDLIRSNTGPFAEMYVRRGIDWQATGLSPVKYADACGALTPGTLAVHAVHIDAADAALLRRRGVTVAHCPKSNGKLAAGVAPIRALLDAGVPVGLGTDSVASNNAVDLFEEMRFAVYQARNRARDVAALTAKDALFLATAGGAAALGMSSEIGSLTSGKRADLCVVRLDGAHVVPAADDNPIGALVFSARASDVTATIVAGRVLYDAGRFNTVDLTTVCRKVSMARVTLRSEAEQMSAAA